LGRPGAFSGVISGKIDRLNKNRNLSYTYRTERTQCCHETAYREVDSLHCNRPINLQIYFSSWRINAPSYCNSSSSSSSSKCSVSGVDIDAGVRRTRPAAAAPARTRRCQRWRDGLDGSGRRRRLSIRVPAMSIVGHGHRKAPPPHHATDRRMNRRHYRSEWTMYSERHQHIACVCSQLSYNVYKQCRPPIREYGNGGVSNFAILPPLQK